MTHNIIQWYSSISKEYENVEHWNCFSLLLQDLSIIIDYWELLHITQTITDFINNMFVFIKIEKELATYTNAFLIRCTFL